MTDEAKPPANLATDDTVTSGSGGPRIAVDPTLGADRVLGTVLSPARAPGGRAQVDLEGATVDRDRYVVGRELARGGMGRILEARDRRLGRPVAIKELLVGTPELRARFVREAQITARLQHPSIVNLLEAGTWPGGEPVYLMKLVSGESLDAAIAKRKTLDERLGLLPNVIAVVDALSYAHSKRIIHRDLKPSNVLVGEFGETVVIDWGLAKELNDTTEPTLPSPGANRTAHEAAGQTQVGDVIGTPSYMSPEQAKGEPVDEQADVYSLGAILYHLLAGAPPYAGRSVQSILDAVIAGPPAPVQTKAQGIPPDLVTIVNKAMAPTIVERYPSATELAEDLKKFQTGQLVGAHHYTIWQRLRRRVARNRKTWIVAAVALGLLAGFAIVSVRRILDEQARTERNRRDAIELASFMLGSLREKLAPLGRLDLLEDVAKKSVAYFDRREGGLRDEELQMRAFAQSNLGTVLHAQGDAQGALAQYRISLAGFESLVARHPTDRVIRHSIAEDHYYIARVLLEQGDTVASLAEHRKAVAMFDALATQNPGQTTWQNDASMGHTGVGDALRAQGDTAGALAEYQTALRLRQAMVAKEPTNIGLMQGLITSHERVGDVLVFQRDLDGAIANYRALLSLANEQATRDPKNAVWQHDIASAQGSIGAVLREQGDLQGALVAFRASLTIAEALSQRDPTNADRKRDASVAHRLVGDTLLALHDVTGALVEYQAALELAEMVAANNPNNATLRRELAVINSQVADVLIAQQNAAAALAKHRAALSTYTELAASDPTNTDRQLDLSIAHEKVGDALVALKDASGALAEYRASLALAKDLAARDPRNVESQQGLAEMHEKTGDTLVALGDSVGAVAEYDAALAIAHQLQVKDPNDVWASELVPRLATKQKSATEHPRQPARR